MSINNKLENFLSDKTSAFGFADISALPEESRRGYKYAISMAIAHDPKVMESIRKGPNRDYAAAFDELNRRIVEISRGLIAEVESLGYRAETAYISGTYSRETYSTQLPHKTVADLAGIGWIGKSALLVTEKFGSAVRLGSVLTNAELDVTAVRVESKCGDCEVCLDICPAGAVAGKSWQPGMNRDDLIDAFACAGKAKELSGELSDHELCGICMANCPWTIKYINSVK